MTTTTTIKLSETCTELGSGQCIIRLFYHPLADNDACPQDLWIFGVSDLDLSGGVSDLDLSGVLAGAKKGFVRTPFFAP